MILSPKELDAQCPVQLDGWVDIDSERWREVDDDPGLTKRWLKMLTADPPALHLDIHGRIWGQNSVGVWFPYHLEYGRKKFGLRLPKKASN